MGRENLRENVEGEKEREGDVILFMYNIIVYMMYSINNYIIYKPLFIIFPFSI